jgi:hypothetical protein
LLAILGFKRLIVAESNCNLCLFRIDRVYPSTESTVFHPRWVSMLHLSMDSSFPQSWRVP